jgi:hypothetical protein
MDGVHRVFLPPERRARTRLVLGSVLGVFVGCACVALSLLAYGPVRNRYTVEGGALRVETGLGVILKREVALSAITGARVVSLRGGSRTAGTALPGHCSGRFHYPELGPVWQATDCGPSGVLVESTSAEPRILLAPPDPQAFLAALRAGTPLEVSLPDPPMGGLRVFLYVLPIFLWASLASLLALVFVGPRRLRYTLSHGELEVRSLFSRRTFPTAGLRVRRHTPSFGLRLGGTALPGYYTGWYRVDGERTLVYATHHDEGALIEADRRCFLTPRDLDHFLEALAHEGARVG